jgi:hypothetical protein
MSRIRPRLERISSGAGGAERNTISNRPAEQRGAEQDPGDDLADGGRLPHAPRDDAAEAAGGDDDRKLEQREQEHMLVLLHGAHRWVSGHAIPPLTEMICPVR